jgi:hypothetical protein
MRQAAFASNRPLQLSPEEQKFTQTQKEGRQRCRPSLLIPFQLPRGFALGRPELDYLYVLCLPALGALGDIELNALTFLKRTEAVRLDGGVMDEDILAVFAAQKSKTLGVIKPLDCSLFHNVLLLLRY